jgi:hypothetical protein
MIHDAKVEVTCDGKGCRENLFIQLEPFYPTYSGRGGRYDHDDRKTNRGVQAEGWRVGDDGSTHYCWACAAREGRSLTMNQRCAGDRFDVVGGIRMYRCLLDSIIVLDTSIHNGVCPNCARKISGARDLGTLDIKWSPVVTPQKCVKIGDRLYNIEHLYESSYTGVHVAAHKRRAQPPPPPAPHEYHECSHEYAGYTVKWSPSCGAAPCEPGYLILKNGANVAPGATYFKTADEAELGIDILKVVDEDAQKWWHLWRAIRGRGESQ